jgi:MFS family permease
MLVFIPVFFFSSEFAQISLGESAQQTGVILLYFFVGFAVAAQLSGRILDRRGAKPTVTFGCGLAAVGFYLWAGTLTQLKLSSEVDYIIMAGAGMGLMLGPASTDAVNRASRFSYGEATGITQTVHNFAVSLGLAILGTVLVSEMRSRVVTSLVAQGLSKAKASVEASRFSQSQSGSGSTASIPHFLRLDFAHATSTVFYAMAGIVAVAAVIAPFGLQRGLQQEPAQAVGASTTAGTVSTTPGSAAHSNFIRQV